MMSSSTRCNNMKPHTYLTYSISATIMSTLFLSGQMQGEPNTSVLELDGDLNFTSYSSIGGVLDGVGTLTADTLTFDGTAMDPSVSNVVISGDITTDGITDINNSAFGTLNVNSGTTQLSGLNVLDTILVGGGATLNASSISLGNSGDITNNSVINFSGEQTITGVYRAATTANSGSVLNGAGTLTASSYILGDSTNNNDLVNTSTSVVVNANLGTGSISANDIVSLNGTSLGNLTVAGTEFDEATVFLNGANSGAMTSISEFGQLVVSISDAFAVESTIANDGTLTINGDQVVSAYSSNDGLLGGSGTLTAETVTLGDGAVVTANLGEGAISTDGTVRLSGQVAGDISVMSGLTLLSDTLTGDLNVSEDSTFIAFSGTLGEDVNVTNAGSVQIQGDETISSYTSSGVLLGLNGNETLTAATYNLNDGSEINIALGEGDIITNGEIALNQTTAGTITVETGTTTLSAVSTGESITIDSGATLNSISGTIDDAAALDNSGTLILNGNETVDTYTSSGILEGLGILDANTYNINGGSVVNLELGDGELNTNGVVEFNMATGGDLTVQSGTTALNAANSGSLTIINEDATLVLAGGALASGSFVLNDGALTLDGDQDVVSYNGANGELDGEGTLSANSFVAGQIETTISDSSGVSLSVDSNNVRLGSSSELTINGSSADLSLLSEFEIFEGDPSITSSGFASLESNLGSDVRAVFNTETGNVIIIGVGEGAFESNSANVLDALLGIDPASEALFANVDGFNSGSQEIVDRVNSILSSSPAATAEALINELAPTSYAAISDYATYQHLGYSRTIRNSARVLESDTWELALGAHTQNIDDASDAGYDLQGTGGYLGVYRNILKNSKIGIFGAIDTGTVESNTLDLDVDGGIIGASYERAVGEFGLLSLAASYGTFEFEGSRRVLGQTSQLDSVDVSTINLEAGYKWLYWGVGSDQLSPFIKVNHIITDVDAISERGSSSSINISDDTSDITLISFGVEGSWSPSNSNLGFSGRAAYTVNTADDDRSVDSSFVGGGSFSTQVSAISENFWELQGGVYYQLSNRTVIDLQVYSFINDTIDSSVGANLGLRMAW